MPRTAISVQVVPIHGASLDDIAWTAADAANDHEFVNTGKEVVIFKNDDSGAHTATIKSVADEHGRTGDVTVTAAASKQCMAGPFNPPSVWNQAGGLMHIDLTADTSCFFAVLRLAGIR